MKNKYNLILFLLISFHLFLLSRLQFTAWPEMFSFPYLVNSGYKLYTDFVHVYPPFLTLFLAILYKVFGYSSEVLRTTTYVLIVLADILVFKITARESKLKVAAPIALCFYIFTQTFLEGNMLWFDTALVVPLLLGVFFYQTRRFKSVALVLFLAFLIKQTALVYIAVYFVLLVLKHPRDLVKNIIFFLLLFSTFILALISFGVLNDFWIWNFWYPIHYWKAFPGYVQLVLNNRDIISVAILSLPVLLAAKRKKFFLAFLFLASLVAIYPRFSFFHAQSAICISGLCLGLYINNKKQILLSILYIGITAIYLGKPFLHSQNDIRFLEGNDVSIAQSISANVPPHATLFLLGIPSQQYVLTKTLPVKPWLDNYGWYYEMPGVSEEVLASFKQNPPQYIVRREPPDGNWYDLGTYEPKTIVDWIKEEYISSKELSPNVWLWIKK